MEQGFNPLKLIKDHKLAREAQALYEFFTEAEVSGTRFTYAKIRNHFPRSRSNIRKYARNYWSWFLRKEPENQGRAHTFSCYGLKEYPVFYFVMAHQRNQGRYYRHFSEALLKAEERDQDRRAELQEMIEEPSSPSPKVPDQQDPEELHIEELPPDEEIEEDEIETELPQDLEDEIPQEADDGNPSDIASNKGGIKLLSIFTLDKQLDQIRAEFSQKMDLLEQKLIKEIQQQGGAQRLHVPSEISQVLKELGQLQGQVSALSLLVSSQPTPLLEKQGEIVTRIQAIEQTLLGGIQQLSILTALSQLPERLEQVQKQVQESILSLTEQLELLQRQASGISASVTSTPTNLDQLQTKTDELLSQFAQELPLQPLLQELQRKIAEIALLSSVPSTLERLQEQIAEITLLSSVPSTLERLQEQIDGISSQAASSSGVFDVLQQVKERLGTELVPVIPSGEQKPDDLIHTYIQKTIEAINALEQDLTTWLDQHDEKRRLDKMATKEKLIQDFNSSLEIHFADEQEDRQNSVEESPPDEQEDIPVSAEPLSPDEQQIPLMDQLSEADTANDRTEEDNFPQPDEEE